MAKQKITLARCASCRNAYLMKASPTDPVVAECRHPSTYGIRNVASTPFPCPRYQLSNVGFSIHPMLKAHL